MAAPAACTQRKATRAHSAGLTAQAALATVNKIVPNMKTPLRPNRSAARPAGMSSAPKTIA